MTIRSANFFIELTRFFVICKLNTWKLSTSSILLASIQWNKSMCYILPHADARKQDSEQICNWYMWKSNQPWQHNSFCFFPVRVYNENRLHTGSELRKTLLQSSVQQFDTKYIKVVHSIPCQSVYLQVSEFYFVWTIYPKKSYEKTEWIWIAYTDL